MNELQDGSLTEWGGLRLGQAVNTPGGVGAITKLRRGDLRDWVRVLHDSGNDEWYDIAEVHEAEAE